MSTSAKPPDDAASSPRIVGHAQNFWLHHPSTGFDLTHPPTPTSAPILPRLTLRTTNSPVTIAPQKTALLIIDMQNYFLSHALRSRGPGHDAEDALLQYGIPAARSAEIQIVWLTWGCTDVDLEGMDPCTVRAFAFDGDGKWEGGIGSDMGDVRLDSGETVNGGRLLMRDQWNAALHPPLQACFEEGVAHSTLPDVRFHKNRISGMCDAMTSCTDFLHQRGIRTLLFTGVNTDQCVLGTLQDANLKGFDTVLLRDGCGTTTGESARRTVEVNCERSWGFVSSCKDLREALERC